jgi:RNA polymerase sigma-70 factor, ECF subfamily
MKAPLPLTSPLEDSATMLALVQGRDTALNEIISRWQLPITTFLYRMVADRETAVDLSQEVFVRLYRNRANYQASDRFSSYIFTIASNLAKNHFRWKKRHPESRLDEDFASEQPGGDFSHGDPGAQLEQSEEAVRVRQAIHSLPGKLRVPIILYYYHDLSQAEIGEVLKCSEKSVENRLYRARKALKEMIGEPVGTV